MLKEINGIEEDGKEEGMRKASQDRGFMQSEWCQVSLGSTWKAQL
jgi:hypothetical protein